jgi:hypothetical protein
MLADRGANCLNYLGPRLPPAQELDVLGPRQRDQDVHASRSAAVEKPDGRLMVDPEQVQPHFAHEREVAIELFWCAEIVTLRIRFERPVSDAFGEELSVAFKEKFCDSSDATRRGGTHRRVP